MTNLLHCGTCVDGTEIFTECSSPVCSHCMGKGKIWMEASWSGITPAGWETCEHCNGTGEPDEQDEPEVTKPQFGIAAIHAAYLTRYATYADAMESSAYRTMAHTELEHIAYAMGFDLVPRKKEAA